MSPTDFDRLIDRRHTASQKWERYRDTSVLPMWVADTDFMAPPAVLNALHQRIDHGIFGYTNTPAELVEQVQGRLQRLYHWKVARMTWNGCRDWSLVCTWPAVQPVNRVVL